MDLKHFFGTELSEAETTVQMTKLQLERQEQRVTYLKSALALLETTP